MTRVDCLDASTLASLLENEEAGGTRECVEHLDACPRCRQTLADLAADRSTWDSVARHLQQAGTGSSAPGRTPACEPPLERVMAQLKNDTPLSSAPEEPASEEELRSILRAPDRPELLGHLGRYEVHELIGQGGMGVVFRAFDPGLRRVVAIKVMAPQRAGSATARDRFVREGRAAAAITHDNVVAIYEVDETAGLPYLVMQYVGGESLQDRLDRSGPVEVEDAVRIGLQTARGLAAAHAQGLIHRDIKPANLLLENGVARVKITDFGLARMADDAGLTQNGVVAGTPEYMAPEQARGEPIDHRADLFSLGSVLYALCTGVPPFRGSTAVGVLRQVSDQEPVPVRALNPNVPAWLEALIARLMAKAPADRFQSAAEVVELLEGYLAHLRQPATAPAPSFQARGHGGTGTGGQGGRGFFGHLVLLLLAVLGLGTGLLAFGGGTNRHAPAENEPGASARRLRGHTGPVHDVRFTRDGRLVSGSGWPQGDRTVRVWDLGTGRERARVSTPAQVHSLDLTPDGRFALVGLGNGLVLYLNLETGQVIRSLQGHAGSVGWAAFAPDGQHAFSAAADGTARMWDLDGGKEVARFRVRDGRARGGAVFPDGRRLLTGDSAGSLQVWDLGTRQEVRRIDTGRERFINSLSLSADSRQVLVAGVGGARLYDLETGREVRHFQEDREEVHQAALSPDGRLLLAASFDGGVRLWDAQTGQLLRVLGSHQGFGLSVAFAPDGRLAASGGGGERGGRDYLPGTDHDIRLWDLTARPAEAAPRGPFGGKRWLAAAGSLFLVLALSSLGLWCYARRNRAGGKALASPPAEDRAAAPATASPPIAVRCPGCGKGLRARAALAGRRVKCPECGQAVPVPAIKASGPGGAP